MPLYDLVCKCGYAELDCMLSVADRNRARCPKCGERPESKISNIGVYFKGTGWTPQMTGPERKRDRKDIIGKAQYDWKQHEREKEAWDERKEEARPKHYLT